MDPSASPWRALDSAAPGPVAPEPEAGAPRSLPVVAIVAGIGAVALAALAFVLAFGSSGGELRLTGGSALAVASGAPTASGPVPGEIVVEIVGAVVRPGVYRVGSGARVGDLIEQAGGYGPRVDVDRVGRSLNLAAPLRDGDQVRVPSRDDPALVDGPAGTGGLGGSGGSGGTGATVDLNAATSAELEALPGIGPVTAAKIIAAREEQPFTSVDELRGRKLLGEKTCEQVRDLVAVR